MAPRAPLVEDTPCREIANPDILKPKSEKAKVEKVKTEPRPKPRTEKAPKVVKPKTEKADNGDGKEKAEKKKADKGDVKAGEKVKVKPVTGDEAVALLVNYLKAQNRPFSATEVSANLHGKVTKTVADKLLRELGEKNVLGMKATNKEHDGEYPKGTQFVFWTPQDPVDAASPEELASMDATIASLKSSNSTLNKTLKTLNARLAVLRSAPTMSELKTMVETLRVHNAGKAEKVSAFKSGGVKMFSREELEAVEKAHRHWTWMKKARKSAYEELEYNLMEGGKSREEIREECGVEADD